MAPPFDQALWYLLYERQTSIYVVVAVYLAITMVLAIAGFTVLERRTRSRWLQVPDPDGRVVAGDGPYRRGATATFLRKAPVLVRMTSLAGMMLGTIGLFWPALLATDLRHPFLGWGVMTVIAGAGTAMAAFSFFAAWTLLRRTDRSAPARSTRVLHVAAALLFCASVACLLHAFDRMEVEAYGIKWRETMTLEAFTRSEFSVLVGGHVGVAWRVTLRAASIFGILASGFIVLFVRVKTLRSKDADRSLVHARA